MMRIQTKFFEGSLQEIEEKFNSWSDGTQYISESHTHFKGKEREQAVMQVMYGVSGLKGSPPPPGPLVRTSGKFGHKRS